ncbi:MAG: MATE family efflux transporter [Agathobacter sp.]|nr:MATE family efflux transporter [Lachnospiraceae bacterium]MDY2619519.1 MATE family efflux transporter [Agathobacter sp.]
MKIQLSEHFTIKKLLLFVYPSIIMMIFTSIYVVIDGLFISNYVGKTAFAAINLISPFIMALSALGFMMGTGGSAIVAKTLGEGKKKKASEYFSMLVYATIILGIILSIAGSLLVPHIAKALGAQGELLSNSILYARINFISLPAFMLQNVFQSFFVTAEKPKLGLAVIITAGVTNMILDLLFVGILGFGLAGAAVATVCGEMIGGLFPIFYFSGKNSSLLRLGKTQFNGRILMQTCVNGSSELMTNLSSSIVNSLYNIQLMKFAGENGVAAYAAIMYVNFIFIAIFLGYSIGSAPIISYHYGAGNDGELKNLYKKSLQLVGSWGILLFVLAQFLATPLAKLFVGYDSTLLAMTQTGFRIYSLVYIINGFNIFGSSFFTALSNGVVSAVISFLRTLVFQIGAVLILPIVFGGINGIWSSVTVAELLTLCITITFFVRQRRKYHYA